MKTTIRLRPFVLVADDQKPERINSAVAQIAAHALRDVMLDAWTPQRFVVELVPDEDGFWKATATSEPIEPIK